MVEPIAKVGAPEQALIDRIKEEQLPAVLVINKIDTIMVIIAVFLISFIR